MDFTCAVAACGHVKLQGHACHLRGISGLYWKQKWIIQNDAQRDGVDTWNQKLAAFEC